VQHLSQPIFDQRLSGDLDELEDFARELTRLSRAGPTEHRAGLPDRINADEDSVEQGLAKLFLTLMELVRQLLEKQAIRRIEAGTVSDDEIERMGETFLKLDRKMTELKSTFGLEDEDLNLNLGPLGNLLPD
jgi:hypothetical protein